jgi:hypothetical protein
MQHPSVHGIPSDPCRCGAMMKPPSCYGTIMACRSRRPLLPSPHTQLRARRPKLSRAALTTGSLPPPPPRRPIGPARARRTEGARACPTVRWLGRPPPRGAVRRGRFARAARAHGACLTGGDARRRGPSGWAARVDRCCRLLARSCGPAAPR